MITCKDRRELELEVLIVLVVVNPFLIKFMVSQYFQFFNSGRFLYLKEGLGVDLDQLFHQIQTKMH